MKSFVIDVPLFSWEILGINTLKLHPCWWEWNPLCLQPPSPPLSFSAPCGSPSRPGFHHLKCLRSKHALQFLVMTLRTVLSANIGLHERGHVMTCHNDETIPTLDDLLKWILLVAQTPLISPLSLIVREVLLLQMQRLRLLPRQSPLLHRLPRKIVLQEILLNNSFLISWIDDEHLQWIVDLLLLTLSELVPARHPARGSFQQGGI